MRSDGTTSSPARDSSSIVPRLECYSDVMERDPDMDELMRVCEDLMQYLNADEGEELVCFIYLVRQKTVRLYDDLDDFAASVAISERSSID